MATKLQTPTPAKGVQFQLNANTFWRTGYTFNGWSTNYASSTSEFSDNAYVTFDGDRDLYALWKANNYQVRFNANGGTGSMGNQTFAYDQGQYLAANAFGRTGYDFNKWTANPDGSGNQYGNGVWVSNLTATPGGIVDLYAQWDIKQYTATFVHNDGTGNTTQKTQDYGTALTAPTLTRTGYKLSSWSPAVDSTMQAENKTYTAQWIAAYAIVTFDKQEGTGGTDFTPVTFGQPMPTITPPTRTGYVFDGYYSHPNGAGMQYYDSNGVGTRNYGNSFSITVYAKWVEDWVYLTFISNDTHVMVTFDANGGVGGTRNVCECGSEIIVPTVTRQEYSFVGWEPPVDNIVPNHDVTYVAQWTENKYTVTFNPGTGSVSPTTKQVTYGSEYGELPTPSTTVQYALFSGWYTEAQSASSTGTLVDSSTTVTTPNDHTLYAWWRNGYTITVNPNGGTGGFTTPNHYYKSSSLQSDIAITLPERTGYTVTGWTFSGYSGTSPYVRSQEPEKLYIPANTFANITMTPTWQAIQCTVTFDKQNGTGGTSSVTATYGQAMPTITVPTRTGYIFGGYFSEIGGAGTQYYTSSGTSARTCNLDSDTILYANWSKDYLTITFDSNN